MEARVQRLQVDRSEGAVVLEVRGPVDQRILAAHLLLDLIEHGQTASGKPYGLEKNYADNFNPETKKSAEAVFSAQSSVNDFASGANGNFGEVLNFPIGGPGNCCGFFRQLSRLVEDESPAAAW